MRPVSNSPVSNPDIALPLCWKWMSRLVQHFRSQGVRLKSSKEDARLSAKPIRSSGHNRGTFLETVLETAIWTSQSAAFAAHVCVICQNRRLSLDICKLKG